MANEVIDVDARSDAWKVVPAMWSLHRALQARGLDKHIKVVTPMRAEIAETPVPPSRSKVPASVAPILKDLFDFLNQTREPPVLVPLGAQTRHVSPSVLVPWSVQTSTSISVLVPLSVQTST